jgi:hypothetical protein
VSEPREGYARPRPELIPHPSVWPPAMALGITFLAWGLITSPVVLGLGIALLVVSLSGWIGDIRNEGRG